MKEIARSEDRLEKIHHTVRRVLENNAITYGSLRVCPVPSPAFGGVQADIEVHGRESLSFALTFTIFDSDDELATRISRALESMNELYEGSDRHDFIYCWCGHSGDTWRAEKGQHEMDERGLGCRACQGQSVSDDARLRPKAMRCPSCDHGHLPFKSPYDPIRYCERCNGLGYLKPSFYE